MKDLIKLIEVFRSGQYTRAELMPRIARLGDLHTAVSAFNELPDDIRPAFIEWIRIVPVEGWGAAIGSIGVEPGNSIIAEFKELAGTDI